MKFLLSMLISVRQQHHHRSILVEYHVQQAWTLYVSKWNRLILHEKKSNFIEFLTIFASALSILLIATTIGTRWKRNAHYLNFSFQFNQPLARFAWAILSNVCGITPSSAATTRTTISVTCAPRARISANAKWPGVSINVIVDVFEIGTKQIILFNIQDNCFFLNLYQ